MAKLAARSVLAAGMCVAFLSASATEQLEAEVTELDKSYKNMPSAEQKDDEGQAYKPYKYKDVDFKVYKPKNGGISIEALGLKGTVSIHNATGKYRGSALGWGSDANTPERALHIACDRIIDRAKQPSDEKLIKGLDDFYDELGKSEDKP